VREPSTLLPHSTSDETCETITGRHKKHGDIRRSYLVRLTYLWLMSLAVPLGGFAPWASVRRWFEDVIMAHLTSGVVVLGRRGL
jgi:hypothetical protein